MRATGVALHRLAFPDLIWPGISVALRVRIARCLVPALDRRLVLVARTAPVRRLRRLPVGRLRPRLLRTAARTRGPLLFCGLADRGIISGIATLCHVFRSCCMGRPAA